MLSFSHLLTLTSLLLTTTLALPQPQHQSRTTTPKNPFYLRTHVTSGDPTKNGLFLVAYHSYAGGNDVALLPNTTDSPSSLAFLNGTYLQFNLEQSEQFPWGLELSNLDGDSYWDNWNAVGINAGYGDGFNPGNGTGFVFGKKGLTFDVAEYDFGGWLACDWARQVPQLFWFSSFVNTTAGNIPSSCAVVDILPVPA